MGHKIPKERSELYKIRKTIANLDAMLRYNKEISVYFPTLVLPMKEIEENLEIARRKEKKELERRGFGAQEEDEL